MPPPPGINLTSSCSDIYYLYTNLYVPVSVFINRKGLETLMESTGSDWTIFISSVIKTIISC